jgi:ABC-type thiamin/hydroxymethylpyrimidine transport system permease subunit
MGILAYTFAFLPNMIWFQGSKTAMVMAVVDGLIQGLGTGTVFAAFWPA